MEKHYKAIEEIKQDFIDRLPEYIGTDIEELHHNMYNTDYYIIGHYQARQWLSNVFGDTFAAIEFVRDYEMDNFGESHTKIEDEHIANMCAYIISEQIINEALSDNDIDYSDELTEETANIIIESL